MEHVRLAPMMLVVANILHAFAQCRCSFACSSQSQQRPLPLRPCHVRVFVCVRAFGAISTHAYASIVHRRIKVALGLGGYRRRRVCVSAVARGAVTLRVCTSIACWRAWVAQGLGSTDVIACVCMEVRSRVCTLRVWAARRLEACAGGDK